MQHGSDSRCCKRKNCNNLFASGTKGKHYCSDACVVLARRERYQAKTHKKYMTRLCVECNSPIPINRAARKAITCSLPCSKERGIHLNAMRDMPPCRFPGCDGKATSYTGRGKDICAAHAGQRMRGTKLKPVVRHRSTKGKCRFPRCGRNIKAQGYCGTHYRQQLNGIGVVPIKEDPSQRADWVPVGTTKETVDGYIRVKTASGWVRQHRIVMEEHIGRALSSNELVHHINGRRSDNRIDNLEICTKTHPPGQRVTDKVEFALEILGRYGGLFGYRVVETEDDTKFTLPQRP